MYAMFVNNAQNQFICFTTHLVNQIDFHQRGLLRVCKTRKQSTHMIRIVPNALSGAPTQPDPNESDALQSGEKLPAWELQPMHIGYFVSKEQNWGKSKQCQPPRLKVLSLNKLLRPAWKQAAWLEWKLQAMLAATNAWQFFSSSVLSKATNWGKSKQKKPHPDFLTQVNTFLTSWQLSVGSCRLLLTSTFGLQSRYTDKTLVKVMRALSFWQTP